MNVLLVGATGLIGTHLLTALLPAGCEVVGVARRGGPAQPHCRWVAVDIATASAAQWRPHLRGIDAVVNLVGIFRETGDGACFEAVHVRGPRLLFEACVEAGIRTVVLLSALGAVARAPTGYLRSKHEAERQLLALPLRNARVLQPSLVFGSDGPSARLFLGWAALPVMPLPAGGQQLLQPVHVDDVVAAILALLRNPAAAPARRISLVGPVALSLRSYLLALRSGMGLGRAVTLAIPARVVRVAARLARHLPGALIDDDAWIMLQQGSHSSAADLHALLGRPPRTVEQFIAPRWAPLLRQRALLGWLRPLLRLSVAAVWIWTAFISLWLYPRDASYLPLARVGVPDALLPTALTGAAALDLLMGVMSLWPLTPARERSLWASQSLLIAIYTLIISVRLPEFWLHPFGPISKNLPLLVLLLLLWLLTPRRTARE